MTRSTERILTTHTGSLTRPRKLLEMIEAGDMRLRKDDPAFQAEVRSAVAEVVRRQAQTGIDIVNDGEQGRVSYATYVKQGLNLGCGGFRSRKLGGAKSRGLEIIQNQCAHLHLAPPSLCRRTRLRLRLKDPSGAIVMLRGSRTG